MLRARTNLPTVLLLLRWADYLREGLGLRIPRVPVTLGDLVPPRVGQFDRRTRVITLDAGWVRASRAGGRWVSVLSVLLHEQVHLWAAVHAPGAESHGPEFLAKALSVGLTVGDDGVNTGFVPGGPFLTLLAARGVR